MGRRLVQLAGAILILVCLSGIARAEPFTIQPNGDIIFHVALTTHGTFTCFSLVPCSGSGTNAVTISSGGGTATFTFTGVNSAFDVGNVGIPITLASITGSSTAGFMLAGLNPNASLFSLAWSITHTSPESAERHLNNWAVTAALTHAGGNTSVTLPTGPTPPQYHYELVYDRLR